MSIEDLGIIASQWRMRLSSAPVPELFERVCSCISACYGREREGRSDACRDLIMFAKAFAQWTADGASESRVRDLHACEGKDEAHTVITRLCFGIYGPYRSGHAEADANNAQTLIGQPLGVQKMHARLHHRGRHEALLFTPWSQVVEILCQNPSIQARDILFMAARRPTQNALLETILMSRWASMPEIRFALASNPYFGVGHALRCACTLNRQYLTQLQASPEVHCFVREQAGRLLAL